MLRIAYTLQLLAEEALSSIHDIEDLADLGRQRKACPYYASRAAVPLAQILVIPYNLLLHKSTREACGIDLKDQVSRYSLTLFFATHRYSSSF